MVVDLHIKISDVQIPEDLLLCRDTKWRNPEHIKNCDNYCLDILDAISDSVKDIIPLKGHTKDKKVIAGWSEDVKHSQNEARFYYSLWLSSGKINIKHSSSLGNEKIS